MNSELRELVKRLSQAEYEYNNTRSMSAQRELNDAAFELAQWWHNNHGDLEE